MVSRVRALFYKVAMIMLVIIVIDSYVLASDQADYSAPYITFEDGKLVTKDPTKEQVTAQSGTHSTDDAVNAETIMSESSSGMSDITENLQEDSIDDSVSVRYIVMISSAVILLIAAIFYYKLKSLRGVKESQSV